MNLRLFAEGGLQILLNLRIRAGSHLPKSGRQPLTVLRCFWDNVRTYLRAM